MTKEQKRKGSRLLLEQLKAACHLRLPARMDSDYAIFIFFMFSIMALPALVAGTLLGLLGGLLGSSTLSSSGLGGLLGSLGLVAALTELLEGGLTALLLLGVRLLLDLVDDVHVHASNGALGLLDDTALAAGEGLSGTLLVEAAVDGSPAELGGLLLLEEVGLVLGSAEAVSLGKNDMTADGEERKAKIKRGWKNDK